MKVLIACRLQWSWRYATLFQPQNIGTFSEQLRDTLSAYNASILPKQVT